MDRTCGAVRPVKANMPIWSVMCRQPWAPGRYGKSDTFDEVAHARKATQAVAHARALVDLEAQVAALEKGDISADELARHLSKASAHLPAGLANRLRDMVLTTAGRSR